MAGQRTAVGQAGHGGGASAHLPRSVGHRQPAARRGAGGLAAGGADGAVRRAAVCGHGGGRGKRGRPVPAAHAQCAAGGGALQGHAGPGARSHGERLRVAGRTALRGAVEPALRGDVPLARQHHRGGRAVSPRTGDDCALPPARRQRGGKARVGGGAPAAAVHAARRGGAAFAQRPLRADHRARHGRWRRGHHLPRRDRPAAGHGRSGTPGVLRPAHRPAQPAPAAGSAGRCQRIGGAYGHAWRGAVHRPGPLQDP